MTGGVRSAGRILLAVLAGYGVVAAMVKGGTAAAEAGLGLRMDGPPTTLFLAANIFVSFLAAICAGYASARLAPAGRIVLTLGLLVLVLLAMAAISARLWPDAQQPPSYLPLLALLGVIGVWTGGMIERAMHG